MYLALQHGIFVANYPLVDEDFEIAELPRPVRELRDRCFGHDDDSGAAQPDSATQEGPTLAMPHSSSAPTSCARPRAMYRNHHLPVINSSAKSVEEMSTVILQTLSPKP